MSIKQINNNINPHGKAYIPGKHITPLEKNSITPPDKIFSPPSPNEIVISLKKLQPPPEKKQPTP